MLAGLLYDDALPFFAKIDHSNGLFPDDVLEMLEDLGISCRTVRGLPRRQPALVAVAWLDREFGGHYVVWDPERGQFLDPLHGLVGRREMMRLCKVEHIWSTSKGNMERFVKARLAKSAVEERFRAFKPEAIILGRTVDGGFVIEVHFASEPPEQARQTPSAGGVPVRICVGAKGEQR